MFKLLAKTIILSIALFTLVSACGPAAAPPAATLILCPLPPALRSHVLSISW